jgi:GMP synthase-like glutamine amidotransferase
MSQCLILEHDAAFGPGRLVPVFRDYGIPTRLLRLHAGDPVPTDLDEVRVLVLLGGTQRLTLSDGVDDPYADQPDWLDAEVKAVAKLVEQDRPVLGFGLGAAVLAKAAGAEVRPLTTGEDDEARPDPHFGFAPVRLPFPGGTDPALFGLSDGTPMFFWQKDGFDLPKLPPPAGHDPDKPGPPPPTGNLLLSSSPWDRNAAFRFKNRLYGFGFHPELTQGDLEIILATHGNAVGAALGSGAVDRIRADITKHQARHERLGTRLLQNLVQFLKAYDAPM